MNLFNPLSDRTWCLPCHSSPITDEDIEAQRSVWRAHGRGHVPTSSPSENEDILITYSMYLEDWEIQKEVILLMV